MIVELDKSNANYQQQLDEFRKIAAEVGGELRGSIAYFRTFDEFNDYKNIFHKKPRQLDEIEPFTE